MIDGVEYARSVALDKQADDDVVRWWMVVMTRTLMGDCTTYSIARRIHYKCKHLTTCIHTGGNKNGIYSVCVSVG